MTWSRRTWIRAIVIGVVVSLAYLSMAIYLVPMLAADRVTSPNAAAQSAARASERGSVRTSMLAVFAGAIAAFGAVYTARSFALNRQGQITERFTRAVDQLGHDKLAVQLGGIYALERIARESADDHRPIVFLLAAFAREQSPWPPPTAARAGEAPDPPEAPQEVRAIIAVLRRRDTRRERDRPIRIDLRHTNLRGLRAKGIHLIGADLNGAQLQEASLNEANLIEADLTNASLREAELRGAKLNNATLRNADLVKADLREADLTAADLTGANVTGANFDGANLRDVLGLHTDA